MNFSLAEIYDMTLDQLTLFVRAANRREKRQLKNDVIAALAGARYKEDSLEQLMRSLNERD
jgi:hypothetical protein